MTATYSNRANMPLSLAVWLTHDTYDHDARSNHISATSLLRPVRQTVLAQRVPAEDLITDVTDVAASRMGSAIHDMIESAWVDNHELNMARLGIPEKVISRVRVNPSEDDLLENPDIIPVYLEQRSEREIDGFIVSGKFDFVGDGRLEDFKSTGTYTYLNKTNDEKYILQGSIYRWLNPDIITRDEMAIAFIFKDWSAAKAAASKNYPSTPMLEYVLPLKSSAETEAYIRNKLAQIKQFSASPEDQIPECSAEDLWRKPTVWKYYKKPEAKRATKVHTNAAEAHAFANLNGGFVREFPGSVTACKYCDAFTVCTQKDRYIASGELIIKS